MEEIRLLEQSDGIDWLVEQADEQGYLTVDDILEAFPQAEEDLAQLEDLFEYLYEQGIDVYEDEEEAETEAVEEELDMEVEGDRARAPDLSNISVDDAISLYFKEMSQEPLLTQDEEVRLAKQLERGRQARSELDRDGHAPQERAALKRLIEQGEEARRHLIRANTRLVVSVAKKYRGRGLPFLDLIQAGNEGLIKAVDKFDYRRGNKLSTYATWWIRQAITRSLTQQGRTIRIPVHMSDRIRRLYGTAQRLEQDLGRQPTPEEIAEELNMEPDSVRWLLRVSRRPLSLERPVGEEGDTELGSFIEDETAPAPSQTAERHLLRESLERMLADLPPREARVLRLRTGLQDGQTHTLREVGEKLGVTRERARQIERSALRKLRHPRHRRKLRYYLS